MTPKAAPKTPAKRTKSPVDDIDIDRAKFPNLAAERDWDRDQHIKQAMKAGMTRKQAERHADDELREG
ncbi:MAG TPA: hypothetical protein VM327_07290 [Candidatus Thermoplasmatota archaeon]|nr:hypothetical protein [Candidatus Thermoplasmatota archaeon]